MALSKCVPLLLLIVSVIQSSTSWIAIWLYALSRVCVCLFMSVCIFVYVSIVLYVSRNHVPEHFQSAAHPFCCLSVYLCDSVLSTHTPLCLSFDLLTSLFITIDLFMLFCLQRKGLECQETTIKYGAYQ